MSTKERIAHLKKRKAELEKLAELETAVSMLEHRLLCAADQANIARIVEAVCISFGVPRTALGAKTRGTEKVSRARQACYWICSQMGMGPSQVGRLFQRDHGAVSYGCRVIENDRSVNEKFRERTDKLLETIKANEQQPIHHPYQRTVARAQSGGSPRAGISSSHGANAPSPMR